MRPHLRSWCVLAVAALAVGCTSGGSGGKDGDDDDDGSGFPNPGPITIPENNGPTGALPDLAIHQGLLDSSPQIVEVDRTAFPCATIEGCFSDAEPDNDVRRLLRFSVGIGNLGTADLYLGDPEDNPELFEYAECHQHYHLNGFADYELLGGLGAMVLGRKQAFCLMDIDGFAPGPDPEMDGPPYTCENQGIHVGWMDIYDRDLPCQWIDITGVPPGEYTLRVRVNGDGVIRELDQHPNVATTTVTL